MTQNKPPWNRINFFVNEKLALELVTTASFQQVKKIIRSGENSLRGISICMQESVTLFLKNMLFSIHFSHRKSTILLACDVSVFPCLHHGVVSFEGTQWISVSDFLTTFLQQGTLLASDSPQTCPVSKLEE